MKPTDAYADLLRLNQPVVKTREAATRLGLSVPAASQQLRTLERSGIVRRLQRGLWLLRLDVQPFALPAYLTAPFPAYVSLWSALARHGMIEQIPKQVYVASLARTKKVRTSMGDFSIHHLAPELFGGYVQTNEGGHLASPEKALFDTIYLLTPRGGRVRLPELELPANFDERLLAEWTQRIPRPRLRTMVRRELATALRARAQP
ncbi:MAG: type IV toxin-antitoxin system AbiEi family antitoxin domain-containing protein [Chloroflexota bacterium]